MGTSTSPSAEARCAARALERSRLERLVSIVVALAMLWSLALCIAAMAWGGASWVQRIESIGLRLAIATLAAFAVNHGLRFARWHLMLAADGPVPPWPRSLAIFLAGLGLLPTPGKAGVAARTVLLVDEGVAADVSLAAYFAERLLDLVGLVMLASIVLGGAMPAARWAVALGVGVGGVVGIKAAPLLCRILRPRFARWPRVARSLDWLASFFADAEHMLSGWRLPAFIAIGIVANIATGLLLWYSLAGSAHPIDAGSAMAVLAVSHLSGSISMLPGGLGGFEVAMLAQLSADGVSSADAFTALAVVRMVTLWGSVALGLPLLWLALRRGRAGALAGR